MKLHGLTPVVSLDTYRYQRYHRAAAIRPHSCDFGALSLTPPVPQQDFGAWLQSPALRPRLFASGLIKKGPAVAGPLLSPESLGSGLGREICADELDDEREFLPHLVHVLGGLDDHLLAGFDKTELDLPDHLLDDRFEFLLVNSQEHKCCELLLGQVVLLHEGLIEFVQPDGGGTDVLLGSLNCLFGEGVAVDCCVIGIVANPDAILHADVSIDRAAI